MSQPHLNETPSQNRRTTDLLIENKPHADEAPSTPVSEPESKKALWAEYGFVPRQDFHDGAPLKGPKEPWRDHAGSAVGLGAYGPDPSPYHVLHSPGHPLPKPNGGG
jgi:hypothetical protein